MSFIASEASSLCFRRHQRTEGKARAAGEDIVDMGMGNPDGATPQPVVDKLIEAARKSAQPPLLWSRGIPALREAIVARYASSMASSWIRKTRPSSPSARKMPWRICCSRSLAPAMWWFPPTRPIRFINTASSWRRAKLACCRCPMPPLSSGALKDLYRTAAKKPKVILISFPHNPTTVCVDLEFMREIVELARGARHLHHSRFRLCRTGLRWLQAAEHSADRRRGRLCGRDLLHDEELQHGGMARRLLPGQSAS